MEDTDAGRYVQFGNKFIHYPQLLRGNLSIKNGKKKTSGWSVVPISHALKLVLLSVVQDQFDPDAYTALSEQDQVTFDRACKFANVQNISVHTTMLYSDHDREELFRRYDVLKGELLAGSDSREVLKKMRNLLLEMHEKAYIPSGKYNKLMREIVSCI